MARFILDKEKYKAAFLYITNKLGEIEGMKKAYKLFYFLDFDFFEAYERPFTGEIYKSLPMGPAPIYFEGVVDELVKEKKIKKDSLRVYPNHEHDTVVYKPLTDTNYKFTTEEKKMLDRIIKLYGSQTGKSLEKLSHAEAPYNAVDLYQVIPYEYSFYRDTPNLTERKLWAILKNFLQSIFMTKYLCSPVNIWGKHRGLKVFRFTGFIW